MVAVAALACARGTPAPAPGAPAISMPRVPAPPGVQEHAPAPSDCQDPGARALSPDGAFFVVAYRGQTLVYRTDDWKLLGRIRNSGDVDSLIVSPDGRHFAVAEQRSDTDLGRVAVYRLPGLEPVLDFPEAQLGAIFDAFGFSPDGSRFFALVRDQARTQRPGGNDPVRAELWTLASRERKLAFPIADADRANGHVLSSSGLLAIAGMDELVVLDVDNGKRLMKRSYRTWETPLFSPTGAALAFVGDDGIELWTRSDGRVRKLADPACEGYGVVFSPDGKRIATGGYSFNLCVYDAKTGRLVTTLPRPRSRLVAQEDEGLRKPLFFSPDAHTLVAIGLIAYSAFDVDSGKPLELGAFVPSGASTPDANWNANDSLIFVRKSSRAVVIAHRGVVQAEIGPGARFSTLDLTESDARLIAVSADGETVARSSNAIEILKVETGARVAQLEGSESIRDSVPYDLLFDSRHFITGDGPLYVWSIPSGKRSGPKEIAVCPRVDESRDQELPYERAPVED